MALKAVALFACTSITMVLLVGACGGGGREGELLPPEQTPSAGGGLAPQPEPPQDIAEEITEASDGVIVAEMRDNFFVQSNLRVPLGQAVTIRAINKGVVIHNLRIAGVDGKYFSEDDFVTSKGGERRGESGEFEFTPAVTGTYTFQCDFHPREMGGVIVVR